MAKQIGEFAVHLRDEEGTLHSFLPGDEVPAWAAKLMGDHCFVHSDGHSGGHGSDGGGHSDDLAVPPQSGRGSGLDKWAAYAEHHGLDVTGLDKAEVIAACELADIPVE